MPISVILAFLLAAEKSLCFLLFDKFSLSEWVLSHFLSVANKFIPLTVGDFRLVKWVDVFLRYVDLVSL